MKFSSSNLKLSKADTFVVNKLSNDVPNLRTVFEVAIPAIHLEGDYVVSGQAFNKGVQGKGTFT